MVQARTPMKLGVRRFYGLEMLRVRLAGIRVKALSVAVFIIFSVNLPASAVFSTSMVSSPNNLLRFIDEYAVQLLAWYQTMHL